jgi:RNA-directed DNA polymerase
VEHRIGDTRIIRLIQKWLKAGVLEEGQRLDTLEGTPQSAVISALLANIYLHYVYDLWVHAWRKRNATYCATIWMRKSDNQGENL